MSTPNFDDDDDEEVPKSHDSSRPPGEDDAHAAATVVGPASHDEWAALIEQASESSKPRSQSRPNMGGPASVKPPNPFPMGAQGIPKAYSEADDGELAATVLNPAAAAAQASIGTVVMNTANLTGPNLPSAAPAPMPSAAPGPTAPRSPIPYPPTPPAEEPAPSPLQNMALVAFGIFSLVLLVVGLVLFSMRR